MRTTLFAIALLAMVLSGCWDAAKVKAMAEKAKADAEKAKTELELAKLQTAAENGAVHSNAPSVDKGAGPKGQKHVVSASSPTLKQLQACAWVLEGRAHLDAWTRFSADGFSYNRVIGDFVLKWGTYEYEEKTGRLKLTLHNVLVRGRPLIFQKQLKWIESPTLYQADFDGSLENWTCVP